MTRKEFEKIRMSIEGERFPGPCLDPIVFGIERSAFEQQKFRRLIAVAKQVNTRTSQAKCEQWMRQLERANASQARFQKLRDEVNSVKRQIQETGSRLTNSEIMGKA